MFPLDDVIMLFLREIAPEGLTTQLFIAPLILVVKEISLWIPHLSCQCMTLSDYMFHQYSMGMQPVTGGFTSQKASYGELWRFIDVNSNKPWSKQSSFCYLRRHDAHRTPLLWDWQRSRVTNIGAQNWFKPVTKRWQADTTDKCGLNEKGCHLVHTEKKSNAICM